MSAPAKASEPTMEEILASIRRIISDDQPQAGDLKAPAPSSAKETDEMAAPKHSPLDSEPDEIDVAFAALDAATPAAPLAKPQPATASPAAQGPTPEDLDVLELTEEMSAAPTPEPATRPAAAPPPSAEPAAPDRLLSAQSDDAVTKAFGSLANTILTQNARTLDDVVQDMLRPMLRAWLDDNLPPLVERLVKQEIERVARGGR